VSDVLIVCSRKGVVTTDFLAQALAKKMTPAAQILLDTLKDEVAGDNANDTVNDSEAAAQLAVSKPKRRRATGVCAGVLVCSGAWVDMAYNMGREQDPRMCSRGQAAWLALCPGLGLRV
jgi:hypothetical protein